MFLFIIIFTFFILIKSTLLYYSNININHCLIEFISTLFSLLVILVIISPALIILLDYDLIILCSFIINSLGLQWAWQFNISFLPVNIAFSSYCDHYIISTINKKAKKAINYNYNKINNINKKIKRAKISSSSFINKYLFEISQYILFSIYSFNRLFVYSFDVIHTLGFYSFAIKIDAIPGRINLARTLRLLFKGEYRGRCFELCGQGHLSMIIFSLVLVLVVLVLFFKPFFNFNYNYFTLIIQYL